MDRTKDEIDSWVDSSTVLAGFPIREADRPSVRYNLEVAQRMNALLDSIVLDDDAEPAAVFRA